MADKRVEITNVLCRKVQLLIKGGATNKEAGYLVGVSAATVSRIRTANYDPFKYQQNTEARRKLEVQEEEKAEAAAAPEETPNNVRLAYNMVPDYFARDVIKNMPVPDYVEDKEHQGEFHLQMRKIEEKKDEDQVPGQLYMDLNDDSVTAKIKDFVLTSRERALFEKVERMVYDNQLKISKAVYTSADRIGAHLEKTERYMREAGGMLTNISQKLDKLNDNLCQILRRMDKC